MNWQITILITAAPYKNPISSRKVLVSRQLKPLWRPYHETGTQLQKREGFLRGREIRPC